MAQAARQNLRMQKELKLLLTDPPPGVSLSDDSSSSSSSSFSLSNINANIKGPEGTVYANGVFRIKIQIPDRYPFQPPNMTFATPIYHPNIDNGGRICLDILNLPPKGAWQPSLNISTVLMSIGLLLSEPNPDDGLMCEASREYKYNKQTFDQKARSMTEKYARSIAGVGATTKPSSPVLMDNVGQNQEPKSSDTESTVEHKKLGRVSRKLSLEFPQKKQEVNIADTGSLSTNSAAVSDIDIHNGQLPCASKEGNTSLNTSLTVSSDPPQIMSNKANNENAGSKKRLGIGRKLSLQPERSVSLKSPLLPLSDNCNKKLPPHQALSEKTENWTARKKLGISRKLSLGNSTSKSKYEDDDDGNKENINPNYQFKSENEKEEEVIVSDAVIVMDSEDSDEEDVKVTRKSRLSIARKPLAGKRKAKT